MNETKWDFAFTSLRRLVLVAGNADNPYTSTYVSDHALPPPGSTP